MANYKSDRTVMSLWEERFKEVEARCPYVGPRPQDMELDDPEMLIGREKDLKLLRIEARNPLLVIHGESGVGKSSLLDNGLKRYLQNPDGGGYKVFTYKNWVDAFPDGQSIDDFFAKKIRNASRKLENLGDEEEEISIEANDLDDGLFSFLSKLDGDGNLVTDKAIGGEDVVLVLDQFEEFLKRPNNNALRRFAEWLLSRSYRGDGHVIISLRSDSMHILRAHLTSCAPHSLKIFEVEGLKDNKSIREIITTVKGEAGVVNKQEAEAVDLLIRCWQNERPRLLELQATLYTLHYKVKGKVITKAAVEEFEESAKRENLRVFEFGLKEAIRLKLESAKEQAEFKGVDEYVREGAMAAVLKCARFLSSGDHKIPVREILLVRLVLESELRVLLGEDRGNWDNRLEDVIHSLTRSKRTQLLERDRLAPLSLEESIASDCRLTSGPMMGYGVDAVLKEEVRRVLFAVDWLEKGFLVRKDPLGEISLIHDGAGPTFTALAEEKLANMDFSRYRFTSVPGESLQWQHNIQESDQEGEKFTILTNVNWRECRISGKFRRVLFMNCDLSGARFESCSFEGVTFLNCVLDDVNLELCKFVGNVNTVGGIESVASSAEERAGDPRAPSFIVIPPEDEAERFSAYVKRDSNTFFSDAAGFPATTRKKPDSFGGFVGGVFAVPDGGGSGSAVGEGWGEEDSVRLEPTEGGVAVVGGRICFFTLYRCTSVDASDVSLEFQSVSGNGLDVVEFQGNVSIVDSAIRALSVSRDRVYSDLANDGVGVEGDEGDAGSGYLGTKLTIYMSRVVNVSFSNNLIGCAEFFASQVYMLINSNRTSCAENGFSVQLNSCRYEFVVNVSQPDGDCKADSSDSVSDRYFVPINGEGVKGEEIASLYGFGEKGYELIQSLVGMDFRKHPEIHEKDIRDLWRKRSST